jgi:hypothetical protein
MLVLDANIPIRAVLGHRARAIITTYGNNVGAASLKVCAYLPINCPDWTGLPSI